MNRLLSTLTQALQSSGIDLSQANISVQIDLGKRANGRVNSSASVIKVLCPFAILASQQFFCNAVSEELHSKVSMFLCAALQNFLETYVLHFL